MQDYECLQFIQSVFKPSEMYIYQQLSNAIPSPINKYCRWVIGAYIRRQFSLSEVDEVRENLENYIQYINPELPEDYSTILEELEEQEEEEEEEEITKPKFLSKIKSKKNTNYQR